MSSEMLFKRTKQRTYKRKHQGRADWWVFMPKVAISESLPFVLEARRCVRSRGHSAPEYTLWQMHRRRVPAAAGVELAVTTSCQSRTTQRIHNSNHAKRQVTTSITASVRYRLIGSWSRLDEGQMSVALWFHTTCLNWTARSCRSMQLLRASARRQFASASRQIEHGLFSSFKPLSISL